MIDPVMLDGITLAYIGDSVMELYVRKKLVNGGLCGSRDLNAVAQTIVNAAAQAQKEKCGKHRANSGGKIKKGDHASTPPSKTVRSMTTSSSIIS